MHSLSEIFDMAEVLQLNDNTQIGKLDLIKSRTEARTPLVAGQFGVSIDANGIISINSPGSYYLTKNLDMSTEGVSGISVGANGVTVDLNGFSLINTTGNGGSAISIGSVNLVYIRNGTIRGGTSVSSGVFTTRGWRDGISSGSSNSRICDVMVVGVREDGISAYHGTVERCEVDVCGQSGIWAKKVIDSVAKSCGGWGISTTGNNDNGIVAHCFGESIGTGQNAGIAANGGTVSDSIGISNTWFGVVADIASHCKGISASGTGLGVDNADNCIGESTSGIGLDAVVANNCTARSTSGSIGLRSKTASFCRATRTGGTAMLADIAIGCTTGGGSISAAQKHLGTP